MAWTAPRTWVTGETVTAALMNTHIKDNLLETSAATVTTAGDLTYADAANSMGSRLAIGAADTYLVSDGSTPSWATDTAMVTVVKPADQTRSTGLDPADDGDLLFTVGANETWLFMFCIFYSASSSSDMVFTIDGPSGFVSLTGIDARENTSNTINQFNATTGGQNTSINATDSNPEKLVLDGIIANGSNAGSCTFQWGRNADSGTLTIRQNSFLIAYKT